MTIGKLDSIESTGLCICIGVPRTTSTDALKMEAGDLRNFNHLRMLALRSSLDTQPYFHHSWIFMDFSKPLVM